MGCSYAIETDEYHGFECSVSGGACMYENRFTAYPSADSHAGI